jgi:hypothetical protein
MILIRKEVITRLSKTYAMSFLSQRLRKIEKEISLDYQPASNASWFHKMEESRRVP